MSRAALVALLGLASLAGCDEPDRSPASPAARVEAREAPREVAELTPPPAPEVPSTKPPTPADDRAAVVTPPATPKGPRSHVFGRVVDESGAALADVHLIFDSVDGEWAAGVDVPIIDKRYDVQGFEAQSDATGRFEFDVPVPTANWISLMVRPDAYHDLAGRNFGPAGGRNEPRLVAGDNDLGEFKLATTGAISGSVIDSAGKPIGGAEVRLDGSFPGGYGRQGESDASGAFTVEHVPAGTYGVEALHKGHQLAKRADVAVAVNATTPIGAITLATASTISGVVIDELGNPVPGARVWGWPVGSGRGSGARADAQGRFVVALAQTEPHVFQVEAEGFAKYEEQHFGPDSAEHAHPVGANDVRIVMKRPVMTTFVVLDAQTSEPVTKFGVKITFREIETAEGTTRRSGGEPEYEVAEHANGEFECEADSAIHGFVITAPGYAPLEGVVTHESGLTPRCVVRLTSGSGIAGRAIIAGKPVANAKVELRPESLVRMAEKEGSTKPFDENDWFFISIDGQTDPFSWDYEPRTARTDSDGRFRFGDLEAADYRLVILKNGARKSVDPIAVSADKAVDLGDVELLAAATMRGHVLVPPEVGLGGLKFYASVYDQNLKAETDEQGRFEISDVPAGLVHYYVDCMPGRIAYGHGFEEQHLAPGDTKELELDLRDRAGCFVRVEIRVNGEPLKGLSVYLKPVSAGRGTPQLKTDAQGVISSWQNALGPANIDVSASSGMPVGYVAHFADLTANGNVVVQLDFTTGFLTFEWPSLPADESLQRMEFTAPSAGRTRASSAGYNVDQSRHDADITVVAPNRCQFAWVATGDYDWTVRVISKSQSVEFIERYYRKKVTVTARAGATCVVTEADRQQGQ